MSYKVLPDLRYLPEHDWVKKEGDIVLVGVTDYAQKSLKDVVYIELPEVGETFDFREILGSIESVKAVSELFNPIGGEIIEVNEEVVNDPEQVNKDPYGSWLVKIKPSNFETDWNQLLTADQYSEQCID
jgi:glycine cleavage system H protein